MTMFNVAQAFFQNNKKLRQNVNRREMITFRKKQNDVINFECRKCKQ